MSSQFVIELDNRPGELAHIAKALAARGVDIRHISTAGAGDCACAFVNTNDPVGMRIVLDGLGHRYIEGTPVLVETDDTPGAFAAAAGTLAEAGVRIYGSLVVGHKPGRVEIAFSVDDEEKACAALGITDHVGVND
jgi:hypothetical protein